MAKPHLLGKLKELFLNPVISIICKIGISYYFVDMTKKLLVN